MEPGENFWGILWVMLFSGHSLKQLIETERSFSQK